MNGYLIKKPIGKWSVSEWLNRRWGIGQGKFSVVFKGIREKDNLLVALKLIKVRTWVMMGDRIDL